MTHNCALTTTPQCRSTSRPIKALLNHSKLPNNRPNNLSPAMRTQGGDYLRLDKLHTLSKQTLKGTRAY